MSSTPAPLDRRQLVAASTNLNGIDFVNVAPNQTQLSVHFLNTVPLAGSLGSPPVAITGGEVVTAVPVAPIDEATAWSSDSQGRPVLALTVPVPGDASTYQLTILSPRLDAFYSQAPLTFTVNTTSSPDCATAAQSCPPTEREPVSIDYLAKDFASFRQALSEFSALRYPAWVERSEADVGVVLMEALAAIADELSYYQDRVSAESTLETATQRLSVVRHARLVDYEPAPATAATTVLQLDVQRAPQSPPTGNGWTLDTPLRCRALGADGSIVEFEVEDPEVGLAGSVSSPGDAGTPAPPWATVDPRWNRGNLIPYYWDDSQRCLLTGATDFYVVGADLGLYPGQLLLLDSHAAQSADPPARELVTVGGAVPSSDVLRGIKLTRVLLQSPTTLDHDLYSQSTTVAGNIVPAVQGSRESETFTIPLEGASSPAPVVVRVGANSTPEDPLPDYRYCLSSAPLAWLAGTGVEEYSSVSARPEIVLTEAAAAAGTSPLWGFERSLIDAGAAAQAFTLTPERYSPVLTSNGTTWFDYDGDGGTTIRFGDGTFGASPSPGTTFDVLYRVGGGAVGNVPADTIVNVAPGQAQGGLVTACTNPFAAAGGRDAETIAQVRNRAPQRFSAELLRAVLLGDYENAAQSLPWVQQAGTTFRWTGSWLTILTSADPVGREDPTLAQLESLTALLHRRRLAGYESYGQGPRYFSIDLQITVVGSPTAFASDVESAVRACLAPGTLANGTVGFFDHSRWHFGQPLEQSALLAAIQSCTGVDGVSRLTCRQRGIGASWAPLIDTLPVAPDQILRVDNDPSRPEAGSLQLTVEGSK
jgi:hypothetical protein